MDEKLAKIRLKLGDLELNCEGNEEFLTKHLEGLASKLIKLCLAHQEELSKIIPLTTSINPQTPGGQVLARQPLDKSTDTIASKLGVKSGPELAIAACAHLGLVKGQNKYTRNEILDEMKEATTFYNANHSSNLSKILKRLAKHNRVNLVAKDTYALSADELSQLESKLA